MMPADSTAEAQLDGPGRVFSTFAVLDWGHPVCKYCDDDLIRHVVRWDDGSVSICWLCSCEPNDADLRVLEAARKGSQPPSGESPSELLMRKGVA
jgi:hypothetical protein